MYNQKSLSGKTVFIRLAIIALFAAILLLSLSTLGFAYDDDEEDPESWDDKMIKRWELDTGDEFHSLGNEGLTWDGLYYGSNECVLYGVTVSTAVAESGTLTVPSSVSTPHGTRTVAGIVSRSAEAGADEFDSTPFHINEDYTDNVSTIILPSTVRYIGERAFAFNKIIRSVQFGGPVMICNGAFANCTSLSDAWAPDGSTLATDSFLNCISLKKMNCAPEDLKLPAYYRGENHYAEDFGITEIAFAPQVMRVSGADGLKQLKKVTFNSNITEIGWWAFEDCSNLETVSLPDSVKYIGRDAFSGCTKLSGITKLPSSLEYLGDEAFYRCKNLKFNVVQPSRIKEMSTAFKESGITGFTWNCSDMEYFNLDAFAGCRNLTFINISGKGFYSDNGILYFTGKYSNGEAFHELVIHPAGKNRGGSYTLPDKMIAIYEYAFDGCSLSTINLPRETYVTFYSDEDDYGVTHGPFDNMDKKCKIYYVPDYYDGKINPSYGNEGFAVIDGKKVAHEWIPYPAAQKGTVDNDGKIKYKVTAAPGQKVGKVTVIGPVKKSITSVSIPDDIYIGGYPYKVTKVGSKAFNGCKKLKKVEVGNYWGSPSEIGSYAFANCPKLTSVTLKKEVKTIGSKTFYKDKKLKTITIESTKLKKVGKNALKGIYKKAKIKVPAKKLKAYKKLFKGKGQPKTVKIVAIK